VGYLVPSIRREGRATRTAIGCLIGLSFFCQALRASAGPPEAGLLLDFNDNALFTQVRMSERTKIAPAGELHQGRPAAQIAFAAVPDAVHDFPAAVIEGEALKVRDFNGYEAINLWVKNPGPDDAELSLAVWDDDGNRSFPIPSTFTIKAGRWQQLVARLVLHGLDAKRVGSIHFFQKANRRPVTLLVADVRLLSPYAGRLAGQIQSIRQALGNASGNAQALGAQGALEPRISELARRLDPLEAAPSANTTAERAERLLELSRISAATQELVNAIRVGNDGRAVVLTGPAVEADWLNDQERLRTVNELTLTNTSLGDEVLPLLSPARDLESLVLDSRRITGNGLDALGGEKLRRLVISSTAVTDDALRGIGKFAALEDMQLAGTSVTSGVLTQFEGLTQLKNLSLAGTHVTDAGFDAIGKLASLESLDLRRTELHGEGLRYLESLTNLKAIDLGETRLDDADLSAFGKLVQLESLSLGDTPITGAGFSQLKGLEQLASLNLNRTRVGDSALRHLGTLPKLQRLELSSTRVTDGGLSEILTSEHLQYLDLFGTNITDAALAALESKQGLQDLFLGGTQISDAGVKYLRDLKNLRNLDLAGTRVTDAALQYLQGTKLVSLKLGKTRISGAGLKHLNGLRDLRVLDLSGTNVTDDNLSELAPLAKLQRLLLSGTRVTSEGMRQLQGAGRLVELQLEATQVGDAGIELLAALPNLQRLNLKETAVTNDGLIPLKKLSKLTALNLSGARVTDEGLSNLGNKYVELDLGHTRITNQGVEQLQRCGQLSRLGLASTAITNDALKLLQVLPGLVQLNLAETAIDDAGVRHLTLLPRMQELNLNGTPVSDRALDAILQMPGLGRLSLEGTRTSAQGASFLRHNAPKLAVDLVFPFIRGGPWSYFELPTQRQSAGVTESPRTLLQQLKDLQGLRYVHIDEALLRPEVLRSLKDLSTLEDLSFENTSIDDDMLAELLGLSQVTRLDFSNTRITDAGMTHLKDMQALREVSFRGTRVTGSGFVELTHLNGLQTLNLRNTLLDDQGVEHLAGLKELRKLELSNTRLTDAAVEHLSQLPRLQYLDLYSTAVTDDSLARLGKLSSLRYCYLTNAKITDAGIERLRRLTELEELALDGTQLTDEGLALLTPLSGLRRLRIGRTNVTQAGLAHLAAMPNLESLTLDGLPIANSGVESLQNLPRLKSLDLGGTKVGDAALAALGTFPSLAELNVRDTGLTADAVARFQGEHPAIRVASGNTPRGYGLWALTIAYFYVVALSAICFYGLHRYWLTWRFIRDGRVRQSPEAAGQFDDLPRVTVQLPMFNERHVAQRVIEAVCALDYPRDKLQVQVLDDSTDESADDSRRCCERMAAAGHRIELLHRSSRDGFKSGALAAGLKTASGELIAMFDADFVPAPDFLRRTIHYFTDPRVGVVQAEWSHSNRSDSWLTELQAMFLDGHFVVEQAVRSRSRRWFNFNGTAGVCRRSCIDDAGGWQFDTLTEDTDISYRAQLKGWTFLYLPAVRCDAELPSTMTAFLGQQHRWMKGLTQTAKKLLPRILFSRVPLRVKLEAWFHLTAPIMYLVMFLMAAVALPAMFFATPFTDQADLALEAGLATLLLGTCGAATFYVVSQRAQGFSLVAALLKIPLLMALGIGVCAVNARAVVEALFGFRSPFVRTPKFGARAAGDPDLPASRRRLRLPGGLLELLMAGVLFACLALSFLRPFTLIGAPFILLFALGYAGVGLLRLMDMFAVRPKRARAAGAPWPRYSLPRLAMANVGVALLAGVTFAVLRFTAPDALRWGLREPVSLALDLTTANWQSPKRQVETAPATAVKSVHVERGSLVLGVQLDEQANEGEIVLDLAGAMRALGDSLGRGRLLAFNVEYSPRFTGEFQAFVKDGNGRSEYGSMQIVESHDVARPVTVALLPDRRMPAMGYQDVGFDPTAGIRQVGLKIGAQSDRVRGAGYRPFRGTIRVAGVRIADADSDALAEPEIRPARPQHERPPALDATDFLTGVDRPWPIGYAFSGPLTAAHAQELERTYSTLAGQGCTFTRVYLGDYRTGVSFDRKGRAGGVEPEFLEYLDGLAEIANRHGLTVMFSLTDNAMLNGRQSERIEWVRDGEASEAFIEHVLVQIVKKLQDRRVIWDVFNEPENATTVPLRDIQRYIDRVLAAARRADPGARFTVVSRSRPEIVYWQGRGLDLFSHNLFTERSLGESLRDSRALEAPIMVAEMAPELASAENLQALRKAGYAGVGIWGWGTQDKYEWFEQDLRRIVQPLVQGTQSARPATLRVPPGPHESLQAREIP
jgi:cellulose synthase/poly-beta-1,6-N-acetylglucosamine synthase-like glycosyltransferase/Leucine-rich repeat (LRR) protein